MRQARSVRFQGGVKKSRVSQSCAFGYCVQTVLESSFSSTCAMGSFRFSNPNFVFCQVMASVQDVYDQS